MSKVFVRVSVVLGILSVQQTANSDPPRANDFMFGATEERTAPHDIVVYRGWGGKTQEGGTPQGAYYSFSPPLPTRDARNNSALPSTNTLTEYGKFVIKQGAKYWVGVTSPQTYDKGKPNETSRPGNAPQIWVSRSQIDNGKVQRTGNPIPIRESVMRSATPFDMSRQVQKSESFNRAWQSYREKLPQNQNQPNYRSNSNFNKNPEPYIKSNITTNKNVIIKTVNTYGDFPGGIILEGIATVKNGQIRSVSYNQAFHSFTINLDSTYDPRLSDEEIAILYNYVYSSKDPYHFGAVSQESFYGVPSDSTVALWLAFADSELGSFGYGYDCRTEILYTPIEGYVNPRLQLLENISKGNLDTIKRTAFHWIDQMEPRLFFNSQRVIFDFKNRTEFSVKTDLSLTEWTAKSSANLLPNIIATDISSLIPVAHDSTITFHVFRSSERGQTAMPGSKIAFTKEDPFREEPLIGSAVKWVSQNLSQIVTESPAWQKIHRYGELLAFLRLLRRMNITIVNQEALDKAYLDRTHHEITWDCYGEVGDEHRGRIRETLLALNSHFENQKKSLDTVSQLAILVVAIDLSSHLDIDEVETLAYWRREARVFLDSMINSSTVTAPARQVYASVRDKLNAMVVHPVYAAHSIAHKFNDKKQFNKARSYFTVSIEATKKGLSSSDKAAYEPWMKHLEKDMQSVEDASKAQQTLLETVFGSDKLFKSNLVVPTVAEAPKFNQSSFAANKQQTPLISIPATRKDKNYLWYILAVLLFVAVGGSLLVKRRSRY